MSNTNYCPITGEAIARGETISRSAANRIASLVSNLPSLMEDAFYSLTSHGSQGGSGAAASRPPLSVDLMAEIDEMRDSLNTWVIEVRNFACPMVPYVNGDWYQAKRIIQSSADRLRRWPDAPQFFDELSYSLARLEMLTSPVRAERRYVGPCPECEQDVTVFPEATVATCPACGCRFDVDAALDALRARLADLWLPREQARRAAEIVAARPVPLGSIKTWIARGKLAPRKTGAGPALYRVGALVSLLAKSA